MGMKIAGDSGTEAEVSSRGSLRVYQDWRGDHYRATNISGTMAAGLAGNVHIYQARMDPTATSTVAIIHGMRVRFVTLTAFTTPVNANRWLSVFKGYATGNSTGGANVVGDKVDSGSPNPRLSSAGGGSIRMATTGALVNGAGLAYSASSVGIEHTADVGNAGNSKVWTWGSHDNGEHKDPWVMLRAGELIAIRNINAMDAAGTWQFIVDLWWSEVPATEVG